MSAKSWAPGAIVFASLIYQRANTGKMFVANGLPALWLAYFYLNPLFHIIDQARGCAFVNYIPHNSSLDYQIYMTIAFVLIGLMIEFVTCKHASTSWGARS